MEKEESLKDLAKNFLEIGKKTISSTSATVNQTVEMFQELQQKSETYRRNLIILGVVLAVIDLGILVSLFL